MNDHLAYRLSRAGADADADLELLDPVSRSIVEGEHASVKPKQLRDYRQEEIFDLATRIASLETANSKLKRNMMLLAEVTGRVMAEHQQQTIEPLLKRIEELERRPALAYRGSWQAGCAYARGSFVSFQGSIWHCNEDHTEARPGTSDAWTLAVKKGRSATATRPPVGSDR